MKIDHLNKGKNRMKIGILTFQRALNYGAVLQAWALQKSLELLGQHAEIIDYRNDRMEAYSGIFNMFGKKKSVKTVLSAIKNAPMRLLRIGRYRSFIRNHLLLSKPVDRETVQNLNDMYDVFITGSDQVWNDFLTDFDEAYFLGFVKDPQKKNSYAASFGFFEFPDGTVQEYGKRLKSFNKISVREQQGIQLVKESAGRDALCCVDPTLLLDQKSWREILIPIKKSNKYILIYSLNPIQNLMNYAKELSYAYNLDIFYISMEWNNLFDYQNIPHLQHIVAPAPEKFVSLIHDAEYVLTNSFHGTVFSLIFHKKFYSETDYGTKINDRIENLLETLGAQQRIIKTEFPNWEEELDWDAVDNKIKEMRRLSLSYLKSICVSK